MIRSLLAAALAFVLCACGGAGGPSGQPGASGTPRTSAASPTPNASTPAAIDSCTLLSDGDMTLATQESVTSRTPSTLRQVFNSVCDIELDGGGSATISILPTGGKVLYETSFEPYIGQESSPLATAVDGLGDKAGSSASNDEVMVLSGDTLFDVLYIEFGRQDVPTIVRYLAEIILARLPCIAAGCPSFTPPPPPSTPTAVDGCMLLTTSEIKDATGFDVLETDPQTEPGRDPKCTWTLNTQPIPGIDYIEIKVMTTGGRAQFDFWAGAYDPPLEHVPDVGDDAIKTVTIPGGTIYAVVGDKLLTVDFSLPLDVDDPYALIVPLVKLAVARI